MSKIHASAIVGKDVEIGQNTVIEPFVVIEDGVRLGNDNVIKSGAYICEGTEIGNKNEIHMRALVGHTPQDLAYNGAKTYTKIGDGNIIREFASIHRGTKEGSSTLIGNNNYLMAYCHIAHNCEIGNDVIMVNQASLTGYCIVEDKAFLSGMTGFHQFSRIGTLAMVSALSACNKDIPPYITCGGRPGVAVGINVVGLRRAGIGPEAREEIKKAYKLLYRSGMNVKQALDAIQEDLKSAEVRHFVNFIKNSERGIIGGANEDSEETLKARKT